MSNILQQHKQPRQRSIPVLMLHMVSDAGHLTAMPHLATPVWQFELLLQHLFRHQYKTLRLKEYQDFITKGSREWNRAVLLTFDDGFLDNWLFAYPLLKKYGMNGVVWVSTEYLVRDDCVRSDPQDARRAPLAPSSKEGLGYLSIGELKRMLADGVFEVGSHCTTHDRVPTSGRIDDFHSAETTHYWHVLRAHPEIKPRWLAEDWRAYEANGAPIYESGLATCSRMFVADPREREWAVQWYSKHVVGGYPMASEAWKRALMSSVAQRREDGAWSPGRYESDEELLTRLKREIRGSKETLEDWLGVTVEYLCWPGGGSCPVGVRLAAEAGYLATTVKSSANQPGSDSRFIDRVTLPVWTSKSRSGWVFKSALRWVLGRAGGVPPFYELWRLKNALLGRERGKRAEFRTPLEVR